MKKYILIDQKAWRLCPIIYTRDNVFCPIERDKILKTKSVKFFYSKRRAIKIAKQRFDSVDVFAVDHVWWDMYPHLFRVYISEFSKEEEKKRKY